MKYEKSHYNEKTGKWETTIVEEDGDFVFSTHTNVPIEKLKPKKNKTNYLKIKKCLCNIPYCAKCLGSNCQDDNCRVHTISEKIRARKHFLPNIKNEKKRREWIVEIKRLENSSLNKTKKIYD